MGMPTMKAPGNESGKPRKPIRGRLKTLGRTRWRIEVEPWFASNMDGFLIRPSWDFQKLHRVIIQDTKNIAKTHWVGSCGAFSILWVFHRLVSPIHGPIVSKF
jgi:hypothetical protein